MKKANSCHQRACGWIACLAIGFLLVGEGVARAQGPQFDIGGPPGASSGVGRLGSPIGASGTSGFDLQNSAAPISGRVGVSSSRAPVNALNPTPEPMVQPTRFKQPAIEPAGIPKFGNIEIPPIPESIVGPIDGLTLDQSIEILIRQNLGLIALQYEIPMARADVITANLRANPVFYADQQLIPYGNYSNARPGGQTQSDININYPLDISRKRKYRTIVAEQAAKSTEAKLQDAVRSEIDNLYTVYVDVVQAMQTVDYSKKFLVGMTTLESKVADQVREDQKPQSDLDAARVQLELARIQVPEAEQALDARLHTLALHLNVDDWKSLKVRSIFFDKRPLPETDQSLIEIALKSRPDLIAYRFGLARASAEIRSSLANRFSDVYVVYQPYTFQNNNYLGLKSAYSWTLGATVTLPVYNRNQGNILRTRLNTDQTRIELQGLEKQVSYDVVEAIREYNVSLQSMVEFNDKVIKSAVDVRDRAYKRYMGGQTGLPEYLDVQKDFNELARQRRDIIVRHRRAMLDLNTAVGIRVMP